MKSIFASVLALAASTSFAAAPTAALNHDPATYRNFTKQAAADYKAAAARCRDMSGNAKDVCMEEAKVARARADADAIAKYNNTPKGRTKARASVANAEYELAKEKCDDLSGDTKDSCVANARAARTAALADARADRMSAAEQCERVAGRPDTACLVENQGSTSVAERTGRAAETVAERTERAAETAVEKTKTAAQSAAEKAREAAATVAQRTERAADSVTGRSENVAGRTGTAVADSVITTKVKADIFKEPELKAMAIHVETEKGVVMLSGFVDSKADADRAVRVARSVEGVTDVKSAILVK